MCGLTGFIEGAGVRSRDLRGEAERMASTISHRGPDDAGVWVDEEAGVALAHRRLAIVDLSAAGAQPMKSQCGRFVIVYNGEIYNHRDIRLELQSSGSGIAWRGNSDTETLLAALRYWGVEECLRRLNGMFAFALWDREARSLTLARDRMGEKPLYYGWSGNAFVFGSELKALARHPSWEGKIDKSALGLFMRYGYVPAPYSIYQGIRKLPPAHFLQVGDCGEVKEEPKCYWDLPSLAQFHASTRARSDFNWVDELDALLRDAVGRRMVADVPLGAFLSGGIDSSVVVAQMQAQSAAPVKTFSIGFDEAGHDEAPHARAIAKHLGTDHTELYLSPQQALEVVPSMPMIYDEPFADSSQIPTLMVSKLARQHVTVSLSGDGGDELFAGYNRYLRGHQFWSAMRPLPSVLRRGLAWCLNNAPGNQLERLQSLLPMSRRVSFLPDRLPKLAGVLRHSDPSLFYRELVSHCKSPSKIVKDATEVPLWGHTMAAESALLDFRERMMLWDMLTFLPDDILTKVDRASMSVGLEARVPLLDHRLVEFSWRVPLDLKIRHGSGKWILRQVLDRYVPRELVERPKQGFGVPIEQWLRGPLRCWAEGLLDERRLREEGFFNAEAVRSLWSEHMSGKRRWHYILWNIVMFQAWNADL